LFNKAKIAKKDLFTIGLAGLEAGQFYNYRRMVGRYSEVDPKIFDYLCNILKDLWL
jgi:hypothetical protein